MYTLVMLYLCFSTPLPKEITTQSYCIVCAYKKNHFGSHMILLLSVSNAKKFWVKYGFGWLEILLFSISMLFLSWKHLLRFL